VTIEPVRGQMVCIQTDLAWRHLLYSPRGYLVPDLMVVSWPALPPSMQALKKQVTARGIQEILSHALELAPALDCCP